MGTLFIVSTPIGNLKDITFRAVETLKAVDLIICEDTRVSGRLLRNYSIDKKLFHLNDFEEDKHTQYLLSLLLNGQNLALISDAGTPLVSDPGFKLVKAAIKNNVKIIPISGISSVLAALTVSGLAPDKFFYLGFLPKSEQKKEKLLSELNDQSKLKPTYIIFESPFRLLKTLNSIHKIYGDIYICICRELTKIYEEVRREKISDSISHFSKNKPKGEFTILFNSKADFDLSSEKV